MESWFLLQTKPRQEIRAVENLERQGVVSFCPQISVEKLSRGKRIQVQEVLFPGYLFISFNYQTITSTTIRSTRGVSHFVTSSGSPVQVPQQLIDGLKQRVAVGGVEASPNLPKSGDKLEILEGPFRGLDAIFSQPDGASRAIVLIKLLNQQVKATLPFTSLNLVDKAEQ
jgi:transcriptional antiterminator RfaH